LCPRIAKAVAVEKTLRKTKVDIRSGESHEREDRAKAFAHDLLMGRGWAVLRTSNAGNRHFLHVADPSGLERCLWFKLGWNPGGGQDSAVQITMLTADEVGLSPAKWSDASVADAVNGVLARAQAAGATDLYLFSLESDNATPVAALLLPMEQASQTFLGCLSLASKVTRNGASPVFWLRGYNEVSRLLADHVKSACTMDLLAQAKPLIVPDSIQDIDQSPIGAVGLGSPEKVLRLLARFSRDATVRRRVLDRANGRCEYCGRTEFTTCAGTPYLEAHHVLSLAANGPDSLENVIALCAAHHREAHYGANWEALAEKMMSIVGERNRGEVPRFEASAK
jgi:HNH endonuclease